MLFSFQIVLAVALLEPFGMTALVLDRDCPGRPPLEAHSSSPMTAKDPSTAMADSPAAQVLRLPELLELILLSLPPKDLLLSQRTCRSFRTTVTHSLRLQRALFMAPDWQLAGRTFDPYSANNRPGRKPENNRLLLRAFPGNYPTVSLVIITDGPSHDEAETGRRGSESWSWDVCVSFPADRLPDLGGGKNPRSVLYPEASWRRMYLSQPPCASLHLVRRWQRSVFPAVVREDGIKMGDFFDTAREAMGDGKGMWHASYISSDRDWHFEGNLRCTSFEE